MGTQFSVFLSKTEILSDLSPVGHATSFLRIVKDSRQNNRLGFPGVVYHMGNYNIFDY